MRIHNFLSKFGLIVVGAKHGVHSPSRDYEKKESGRRCQPVPKERLGYGSGDRDGAKIGANLFPERGEIRATIKLKRGNAMRAFELLASVTRYEAGWFDNSLAAYLRGQAYLAPHRGQDAAAECQKIFDHRGIVLNGPIGALADLQIGRAYAMQGDTVKAKAAYQDFLTLWKDGDPDIPVLIEAKAEYAKLK
jgi:hypothetical protein